MIFVADCLLHYTRMRRYRKFNNTLDGHIGLLTRIGSHLCTIAYDANICPLIRHFGANGLHVPQNGGCRSHALPHRAIYMIAVLRRAIFVIDTTVVVQ